MKTVLPGDHPTLETVPGRFGEIIIVGENAMMMRLTVQPNVPTPPHNHPHEQVSYIAEGELILFMEGVGEQKLVKGDLFAIPSGIPHTVQVLTKVVRIIDSFTPVREDFL